VGVNNKEKLWHTKHFWIGKKIVIMNWYPHCEWILIKRRTFISGTNAKIHDIMSNAKLTFSYLKVCLDDQLFEYIRALKACLSAKKIPILLKQKFTPQIISSAIEVIVQKCLQLNQCITIYICNSTLFKYVDRWEVRVQDYKNSSD